MDPVSVGRLRVVFLMCGPLVAQVSSFAAGDEVAAVRVGLLSERRFDILLSRFQLSRTSPERVCLRFREPSMVSPRQVPMAGVVLLQNRRTSLWRRVARFRSLCCESVRRCGCRLRVECGWHRSASQGWATSNAPDRLSMSANLDSASMRSYVFVHHSRNGIARTVRSLMTV